MGQRGGEWLKMKANKLKKKKAPAKVPHDAHKELNADVCRFYKKGHYQKDWNIKLNLKRKVHLVSLYISNQI